MFGKRLQALREAAGLTQKELGRMVNLSQQTIDHYEKGRSNPSIETINQLANIFKVSTDYLLGRTDFQIFEPGAEYEWPEAINVLRRAGRKPTPAERKRIARLMEVAIEEIQNDDQ
ncbi:MAG TPA: helix-turn-helix transcriptional regulator [Syntrophomonadaceae bacterium]|nr:helix-turn-helix transcriptional regulator [Syntrophomonadaceae bacterium]HPU49348.1 helix-turn-helix transcriptional regulator [Syntrophomonadaceae bacterium]